MGVSPVSHALTPSLSPALSLLDAAAAADDKSWAHKALVAGQEPANSMAALKEAADKAAAAEAAARAKEEEEAAKVKEAAAREAAAQKAAADAAAAAAAASAAAAAAAASETTRGVQTDATSAAAAAVQQQQQWGMDLQDSASVQAEAAQQRAWTSIIANAASWGTIICIAGLLGLVVLWQMRAAAPNMGPLMGRRWGRYAPLQRRPPSPAPADRMV